MEEQARLLEELESDLLGGEHRYTRQQVAERSGVPHERAVRMWRALGFATVAEGEAVFTDDDVAALRLIAQLVDLGVVGPGEEASLSRALGQSMARLAEWQTAVVRDVVLDADGAPRPDAVKIASSLVPVMERLQSHVWRRHLIAAASRMLVVPEGESTGLVGFADIVSFTRLSRSITDEELAEFVEHFESTAAEIVAEGHGRVVKTIGDEVMFVADEPRQGAEIGLRLAGRIETDEEFPAVRVGLAYGPVLRRLGDVFGPVVNVAARLTSLARPGTVLVDRALRDTLESEPEWSLRRVRRVSVRGYTRLEPWALRPTNPHRR